MNCDDGEAGGPTEFLLSGSREDCPAREHLCIEITLVTRHIPVGKRCICQLSVARQVVRRVPL